MKINVVLKDERMNELFEREQKNSSFGYV